MGREAQLGGPLGGPLGGALGLRPATGGGAPAIPLIQLLLVGGGGAGDLQSEGGFGNPSAGLGGAGGQVIEVEILSPALGAYAVKVGLGGVVQGANAGATSFANLLVAGPGGSGNNHLLGQLFEMARGSGFNAIGQATNGYPVAFGGFLGGAYSTDYATYRGAGGGAGAGGPGGNATPTTGGLPGPGRVSSISGVPVEYGRGGQGGHTIGGIGPAPVSPGDGGGGRATAGGFGAHNGNAGILIARYLPGTQSWTGGNVSQVGPWTVHTFTADGTFTRTA